ncbi:unnamed protein product, partial [Didymodactylos carnosus]
MGFLRSPWGVLGDFQESPWGLPVGLLIHLLNF